MINHLRSWHNAAIGERVVKALQKNRFEATYCTNAEEAVRYILEQVPEDAEIGVGGSVTLGELGILELLEENGHTIYNHNRPGLEPEVRKEYRHKQLSCDVFLTSTNAVTIKGELVNRDGVGNRVASMIFGPKKVIVVAGMNKVVKDLEEAEHRIKVQAGPLNNKRIGTSNPCCDTGLCAECQNEGRICNVTTVMHKRPTLSDIHVVIIGENLGF